MGTARRGSLVDADCVVGCVGREARDLAVDLGDQIEGRRCVVHVSAGQGVGDDHAGSVHAQMELLPTTDTATTVLHSDPLAFTQP